MLPRMTLINLVATDSELLVCLLARNAVAGCDMLQAISSMSGKAAGGSIEISSVGCSNP